MFDNLKKAYGKYKEDKEYERNLKEDIAIRDKMYREEARKQAQKEFEEERKEMLEFRKNYILAQERKKYDCKRKTMNDTRTKSQKFKSSMKKLGKTAGKVGGDIGVMGKGFGNFSSMMHDKVSKNLGVGKKNTSFEDRIRRNL